jgi:hypothetical protein
MCDSLANPRSMVIIMLLLGMEVNKRFVLILLFSLYYVLV